MQPHRTFRIGEIEIIPLWDGTLDTKLSYITNMNPDTAGRFVAEAGATQGSDPLVLPVWAFLVRTPLSLVLIDTGGGASKPGRLGFLPDALAKAGIAPEAIDLISFTHLHRDHYCGLVDTTGRPRFSRAELLLHRVEAEAWLDTPFEQQHPRSQRHSREVGEFLALYGGRVRRVGDGELLPGLSIELAPGHTPGHSCFVVRSGGDTAVLIGDVVHLAAVQLPRPETTMHYDCDPELATLTRKRVLGRCAAETVLVMGSHLPSPGVGRIEVDGAGYRFVPAHQTLIG